MRMSHGYMVNSYLFASESPTDFPNFTITFQPNLQDMKTEYSKHYLPNRYSNVPERGLTLIYYVPS